MLERLAILIAIATLILAAIVLVRAWAVMRSRRLQQQAPELIWQQLGVPADGRATLVAFSTPSCAACHTAQAPAVRHVQQEIGAHNVRVVSIDAARQPRVAQAFGILTVPSTVVLGASGHVLAVNHGFAASDKLTAQLLH
jgi:thiol-disulfide isomerase/thioredoxin